MITPFQLLGAVNRYSASYRELVSRSDTVHASRLQL